MDDFPALRQGVKQLLGALAGIEVCGEAASGEETLEQLKRQKPDLVVLDLNLPGMNGLEAARAIREAAPATEVLIFTMHFSNEIAREALRAGVRGYVLKSDPEGDLLAAVEHLRAGKPYFTAALTARMAESFLEGPAEPAGDEQGAVAATALTEREAAIVQLLAAGKGNKEIAAALGVSRRTIEGQRTRIMRKMNFGSFSELVRFAIRNGLMEA